jgi:hypothetical protein
MKYFDMEEVINKQKDFVEKVKHLGGGVAMGGRGLGWKKRQKIEIRKVH